MPDKIHFRKSKQVGRVFYMVDGKDTVMVLKKSYRVSVEVDESGIIADTAMNSHDIITDCTKEEFEKAFTEAMEVLHKRKIV